MGKRAKFKSGQIKIIMSNKELEKNNDLVDAISFATNGVIQNGIIKSSIEDMGTLAVGTYLTYKNDSKGFNLFELTRVAQTGNGKYEFTNIRTNGKFWAEREKAEIFWLQKNMQIMYQGTPHSIISISSSAMNDDPYDVRIANSNTGLATTISLGLATECELYY